MESEQIADGNLPEIYTDGSKDGDNVDCAWVFEDKNKKLIHTQYRLSLGCSNNQEKKLTVKLDVEYVYKNITDITMY